MNSFKVSLRFTTVKMHQDNFSSSTQFLKLFNGADSYKLQPIVKWAGGKEQELKYILPNLPAKFNNFYEPFVGGGSVYTSVTAKKYFINDKSEELISLYKLIAERNNLFYSTLAEIVYNWQILSKVVTKHNDFFIKLYDDFNKGQISDDALVNAIYEFLFRNAFDFNGMFSAGFNFDIEHFLLEVKKNLIRKFNRMKALESERGRFGDKGVMENIETAFKSAFYMHFRYIYNNTIKYNIEDGFRIAVFLFIRNYAYSGMFRYNNKGDFNVPYGGIGYNKKNFTKKINYLRSNELNIHLNKTTIECLDFESFFVKHKPKKGDFIFLDPPYDSEFSTYANNSFDKKDQERLASYLIQDCKAKWMMIIKNTDFIFELYSKSNLIIKAFDKKYLVSFMNRNNKDVQHLMITNY